MAAQQTPGGPPEPAEGTCATFQIADEGHTLGNSLRFMLNKNPHVHVAGYDRPHPSDTFINVRVQTTGDISAVEALRMASSNVQQVCTTVADKFNAALAAYVPEEAPAAAAAAGKLVAAAAAPQAPADAAESSDEMDSD